MAYERILASAALAIALIAGPAQAQKSGGVLKIFFFDSPATMSIHEESTIAAQGPMMGVFNNLVVFDQQVKQNSLELDRARSGHRLVRFAPDSPLEGTGFEPSVPPFETAFRLCGTSRSAAKTDSFLRAGPAVRIRLPPARSPVRT